MQIEAGERLRKTWAAKGDSPCYHSSVEKEYSRGADTGDEVCKTCGHAGPRGTLQARRS